MIDDLLNMWVGYDPTLSDDFEQAWAAWDGIPGYLQEGLDTFCMYCMASV